MRQCMKCGTPSSDYECSCGGRTVAIQPGFHHPRPRQERYQYHLPFKERLRPT